LFDSSGPARPCNSQNNFILACTLFLPGGEVFNEAEPCNIQAKKSPAKIYVETRPRRRSSTFDQYKVTASCSASYPHARHSAQKSPKGAAGLAQQVHKIEVFSERLSVQKSPKGVAGLAQQVRKIEVFSERLSVQKSPKGAAGLAQQVRKIEVFSERLSVQKSPKGAAGLAQQVRKIEVFLKRLSVQKSPQGAAGLIQQARQNASALRPCTSLHQETIRTDQLQAQPDQHNKCARPNAQRPYRHSRMREGTRPHHTNYSNLLTARASHLTSVQPSE
jgi:hypothetical protein